MFVLVLVPTNFHNLSLSSGSSKSPRLGSQDLAEDRTLALWTSKFGLKNLLNSSTVPSTFRDLRSQRDAVSHLKGSHLRIQKTRLHNGHPCIECVKLNFMLSFYQLDIS